LVKSLASGASSFSTFVQVAPRLVSLFGQMRPTWHLPGPGAVTPEFLRAHGLRGIIWDVDGTLTGDRQPQLFVESDAPLRTLLADTVLKHVVLSNAGEERFRQLGTMFPSVPILRAYTQDGQTLYRRLRGTSDTWTSAELEQRLASGARVIRKPSAALVDYAVRELGCAKDEVVMIGDQYLTDVAGANLGGVRSIKVPTLARETFRASVQFSQRLETALYAVLHGRAG
jgi:predicted HAD superfamily phosphohydrolase YqeG